VGNTSTDGTHLEEKALHITVCQGIAIAIFSVYDGWIDRFRRRYNIVYRPLSGESDESRSVDSETVEDWKNDQQEIEGYDLCDMYNADETGLFFSLKSH
jgi:hypothetical protein